MPLSDRDKQDWYARLGVPYDASPHAIDKLFHQYSWRSHPDTYGDISPTVGAERARAYTNDKAGYEILLDSVKRRELDEWLAGRQARLIEPPRESTEVTGEGAAPVDRDGPDWDNLFAVGGEATRLVGGGIRRVVPQLPRIAITGAVLYGLVLLGGVGLRGCQTLIRNEQAFQRQNNPPPSAQALLLAAYPALQGRWIGGSETGGYHIVLVVPHMGGTGSYRIHKSPYAAGSQAVPLNDCFGTVVYEGQRPRGLFWRLKGSISEPSRCAQTGYLRADAIGDRIQAQIFWLKLGPGAEDNLPLHA